MPISTVSRLAARVTGKLPLRTVLIVPFVVQIVGTVGLVGYLSYKNGQKAVEDLAYQLMDEVDERVEQNLQHYLDVPKQINQNLAAAIRTRVLDWKNFSGLERYFAQQLQIYNTVSNVAIATEQKDFLAVEKSLASDSLIIRVLDKSTDYAFHYYAADRQGKRIKLTKVRHDYNPHNDPPKGRPWYQKAKKAAQTIWLPVVNLSQGVDRPLLTMVNFLPFDDSDGKFQGVLGASLYLPQFASFLDSLNVGQTGQVFIIDRQGLLIASSTGETPFKPHLHSDYLKNLNPQEWRLVAQNSNNPLTQASVNFLLKQVKNLSQIEQKKKFKFDFHHNRHFLQVNPIPDKSELGWLIITVVPEIDFMTQINANTRTAILLCIVALIGSTGIGIITAHWITKPILQLNSAAKDITKGQWDKPVEIERADEVGELAKSFNRMAAQLQQSFAELNSLNESLAQRESQLRQFLDAIPVGVSIHEATGKVVYFNQAGKRLLGIEIIPDATSEEMAAAYQLYRQNQLYPTQEIPALRALNGETVFLDDIELHRDGKIIPFEVYATPIFDDRENILYAIVAFTDISARKQAEQLLADYNRTLETQVAERTAQLTRANQQLQREKELRETIYNESTDAIFLIDPKTRLILDCNQRAVELFEVTSKEDLIGIEGRILQRYPFTPEQINQISIQMYQQGFWCREIEYVTRNGNSFWGNIAAKPIRIAGEAVTLVQITDISDRKLASQAVQTSQARFAGILEIANDAIITVDAEQRITLFNQGAEKIFGYTAEEILGQPLELLLPSGVRAIHRQYITTFGDSVGKARQMGDRSEIFGRRKDGTEFPAEASISKLEINGEKIFTTILRDISDRKQAELALQTKTEELDRFFGASLDLLCIANTDGYFLRLNPQWEKTLGYRLEELEGTRFLDYVHPEDLDSTLDAIAVLVDQQEVPNFVNRYRCRDGSYRWIEWRSVPMGNLIYAAARDMTERTQAEEALRQSEATNRAILSTIPDLLIWMNQDGTYLEITIGRDFKLFNPGKYRLGNNIYNVLPHSIAQQRMEYVERALQTGELQVYEHQLVVEGETRYEETRIAASEDGKVLVMVRDITARKRTEETLREREEQLQLALEGSGDGFWDWKIQTGELYLSSRYLEMLGYEVDELPQELSTWEQLIHPDDKPWVMETLNAHLANSSVPYKFDYRLLTKSREWKWIANYGKVVARDENGEPLRMTGTHRDVSDKKLAEQQLQWKEALLRSMTSASPLAFYVVDNRTDAILYFNRRFCEIWGIEHLEERLQQGVLTNNNIIRHCIPVLKDVVAFAESCKPLQSEENRIVIEDEIPFADGRTIRRFSAQIRNTSDRYFGRLYIFEDITDRKQSQTALQQAKEAAETANRAKSRFLANMSHELRTPLNGILGYAQILQADANCTPKQKKGVGIIHQCGTHLLTLINDILDLSKIEAGKVELYPEDFDFCSLLTGLSQIFQLKAAQKSIIFTYLPLNQLPTMIHADQKRLRQVLMNLLSNAVKFTDAGSVTFKVETIANSSFANRSLLIANSQEQLTMNHEQRTNNQQPTTNNQIRFHIEDTGIGIPSEQLEKIFLPFEQVGDISRREEGTGLGLAITQKILELMGGKIFVESTPGVGSKFWFDLDVPEISTLMKSITVKSTDNIIGYPGEKRKILIVDDRWENRAVFVNILEPSGFELEEAANGQEGLDKALEFQPDLILADLVMPVMDGYQMTQRLRQLPEFQDTIIIAISANVFEDDRLHSLDAGCNDFLPKPVQIEEFLNLIKRYLNLSWIYGNKETGEGYTAPVPLHQSASELVIPPQEELVALYEATQGGDVLGVEQEASRLQQLNPEYCPFANRVLELAEEFEYEEIIQLIDSRLSAN